MPTLLPICAVIVESCGTSVNFNELISAVVATSFVAAISPLSTVLAIISSSYIAASDLSIAEQNKLFKTLFLLSVANVALNVAMSAIGLFGLFGLGA